MKKVICQLWKKSSCEYISKNSIVSYSLHLNKKHRLFFICNQNKNNNKIVNLNRYYFCNIAEKTYNDLIKNQMEYGLMFENNKYPKNTKDQILVFDNYDKFLSFFEN